MRVAAFGGLRSGEVVVSDPRRVGAAAHEQLGGVAPTTVGGAPQRVVEVLARRRGLAELLVDTLDELVGAAGTR